jgi:2-hydroxychromene-2-carboxylate isomerase
MPKTIEFFFDFSSPNAYFAAMQLPALAERHAAHIVYKPFLLGGLFKALDVNMTPGMTSPAKSANSLEDMQRWSAKYGIPFRFPTRFPMNTVAALRTVLALSADERDVRPFVEATYRAYWVDDRDISDAEVLRSILGQLGLDGAALLGRTQDPAIKQALKDATAEAQQRGLFGAPTFIVGGELYFGKDRLDFVEDAL